MIANASNYWISPSLVTATLNVDGIHNRVMINIDAKALLYVHIAGTVDKIKVHNAVTNKDEQHFQSFRLSSLDAVIPDSNPRYVYAVIPKTTYSGTLDALPTPPQAYLTLLTGKVNIDGTSFAGVSTPSSSSSSAGVSTPSEYPSSGYLYIYLGGIIGTSETNGTIHDRYWQETIITGTLSPVCDALPSQYWIKQGAINITLNALADPDKILASTASEAVIMAYIPGYDGLDYNAAHNYRRWPIAAYPTAFGDAQQKYVYIAIPRSEQEGNTAYLVFPSQHIGIDGKNQHGDQIGSERYYYIFLRAIISSSAPSDDSSAGVSTPSSPSSSAGVSTPSSSSPIARYWLDEDGNKAVIVDEAGTETPYCPINFGSLSTDDNSTNGSESEWWQYNPITKLVTFLKTIATAAFNYLFANKADITTLNVTEETVTSQQVINHTDWGTYTPDATGATVRRNEDGNWLIETDYLKVRKKATFNNVEIQDAYHVGGQQMLTSASCHVALVEPIFEGTDLVAYRVFFKKKDSSGQHVDNTWLVGDQAYCNTFNELNAAGTQSNHFLWRLVTALNTYPTIKDWYGTEGNGKIASYITLAQQAASETITLQHFIEQWQSLLSETRYIITDAEALLPTSNNLTNIRTAITVATKYINRALDGRLNALTAVDFVNNGLKEYASCLDALRTAYLAAAYHTITLSNLRKNGVVGYAVGSDAPLVDDKIIQLGFRSAETTDKVKNRQGALILAGAGANSPYIYMFKNIGRRWSETKAKKELGEDAWNAKEDKESYLSDTYFTLPTPYMQFSPAKTVINSADVHLSTANDTEDYDDDNPNSITNIFNSYDNRINALQNSVDSIDEQTDGSFRIWQGENMLNENGTEYTPVTPITPSLFVPSESISLGMNICMVTYQLDDNSGKYKLAVVDGWKKATDLPDRVDDFYIATDGRVWQFKYNDNDKTYSWDSVTDEYLIAFVNQIKEKKRVFLLHDSLGKPITSATDVALYFNGDGTAAHPSRAYDIGDLWVSAYYYVTSDDVVEKRYDNDILVCTTAKGVNDSFSISHWNKANNDVSAELMAIIAGISADNKIVPEEKVTLADKFNKVASARSTFYNDDGTKKYSSLDYTEYEAAYINLRNVMYAVFGITEWKGTVESSTKDSTVYAATITLGDVPLSATKVAGFDNLYLSGGNYYISSMNDDSVFNAVWSTYYNEEDSLSSAILSHVLSVADTSYRDLNDMANDNVIALSELPTLRKINTDIETECTNLVAYGNALGNNTSLLADDFSTTKYNAFAAAYNAYLQAYLDYHAFIDMALNYHTKSMVMYYKSETDVNDNAINIDKYPLTVYDRFIINRSEAYVLGSTNLVGNNSPISESNAKYQLNTLSENNNKNLSSVYGGVQSLAEGEMVSTAQYLTVIANYRKASIDLQNQITAISQYLAEENARSYAQSILGAAVADNILTANEKRAICQELNSIGSEYKYAVTKAYELLSSSSAGSSSAGSSSDGVSTPSPSSSSDGVSTPSPSSITAPTEPEDTPTERQTRLYQAQLAVYNAFRKMTVFFNVIAGGEWRDTSATLGNPDFQMTNGIARAIGISRKVTWVDSYGDPGTPDYTFTVDTDTKGIAPDYDLTNFLYYIKASRNRADGSFSDDDEIVLTGGSIEEEYSYSKEGIWYIGRDGGEQEKNTFLDAFSDYYNARDNFSNAVTANAKVIAEIAKETGDDADKKGDDALNAAGEAKSLVYDIVSDYVITRGMEKYALYLTWMAIKSEHDNYVSTIGSYGLVYDEEEKKYVLAEGVTSTTVLANIVSKMNTYITKYNDLDTFLNTTKQVFKNFAEDTNLSETPDERTALNTAFTECQTAAAALAQAIPARALEVGQSAADSVAAVVGDDIITKEEKTKTLLPLYNSVVAKYSSVTLHDAGNSFETALTNAYNALNTVVSPILSTENLGTVYYFSGYTGDKTGKRAVCTNYDNENTIISRTAFVTLFKDFDTAYSNYTGNIDNMLHDITTDGLIDPTEKKTVAVKWNVIYVEYSAVADKVTVTNATDIEKAVVTAYNNVTALMQCLGYDTDSKSASTFRTFTSNADSTYYLSDYTLKSGESYIKLEKDGSQVSRSAFDDYFVAFDSAMATYQAEYNKNIAAAKAAADTAAQTVEGAVNDNLITPTEIAQVIAIKWANIYYDYNTVLTTVREKYASDSKVQALSKAYGDVEEYVNALGISLDANGKPSLGDNNTIYSLAGYNGTTSFTPLEVSIDGKTFNPTRVQFIAAFSAWDNAYAALNDKRHSDNTNALGAIADDGVISAGSEKTAIYNIMLQITSTKNSFLSQSASYGVDTSKSTSSSYGVVTAAKDNENVATLAEKLYTYYIAYTTLYNYICGHEAGQLNLFGYTDNGTVVGGFLSDTKLTDCSSTASAFRTAFDTYYTAESDFAKALEDFKVAQLAKASIDMVGGSINISADTDITIDSSKVKVGDSNLGAWFTFAGGKLTGNGIKMNNGEFNGDMKVGTDAAYIEISKVSDGAKMTLYTKETEDSLPQEAGYMSVGSSGPHLCFHSTQYGDITFGAGTLTIGKDTSNEITIEGGEGDFTVKRGTDYYDLKEDTATNTLVFKKRT